MPISLEIIERKLENLELSNMSELESYFKRMVGNAKEYYPRTSQIFEDAERVRKATSNYMTRTNPAYKLVLGYTAMPIPIPPDYDAEAELRGERRAAAAATTHADEQGEDDAEGEDDEMADADADGDEEDDQDAQPEPTTRIVLKRRGGRPSSERNGTPSSSGGKGDIEYANVPYKGLTFQQAQEKLVDALIRRKGECVLSSQPLKGTLPTNSSRDDWPYFDAFLNLPPKSLKDYYQLIEEPISLTKLQRLIKGMHGRGGATGISDFKSWAAFEEKASLLWDNALYYNEDGSEISELAQELKVMRTPRPLYTDMP